MNHASDTSQAVAAARAIDRVLGAETAAQASLAQAAQQAQQTLERAREDALAGVNRAQDRVAAWQRRHAAALDRRLADLRAGAAATAAALKPPDEAAIAAAVALVAARLTGGTAGAKARHDPP